MSGRIRFQTFKPRHQKADHRRNRPILARHYGFTDEELDFIINYDIKYRMGQDDEEEEDE